MSRYDSRKGQGPGRRRTPTPEHDDRGEQALLARFAKAAGAGEMLKIHDLKSAYEAIGHPTSNSTMPLKKRFAGAELGTAVLGAGRHQAAGGFPAHSRIHLLFVLSLGNHTNPVVSSHGLTGRSSTPCAIVRSIAELDLDIAVAVCSHAKYGFEKSADR
jgi:hypothetical protein